MKNYQSWMIKPNALVQAESKSEAAQILSKITNNKERYCKESLLEANAQAILRCVEVIKMAKPTNTIVTIKLDSKGSLIIDK